MAGQYPIPSSPPDRRHLGGHHGHELHIGVEHPVAIPHPNGANPYPLVAPPNVIADRLRNSLRTDQGSPSADLEGLRSRFSTGYTGRMEFECARAPAQVESCRPAHLSAAIAATGSLLADRIARLLSQSRPAVRTGPGPGVLAVAILLVGAAYGLFGQSGAHPSFRGGVDQTKYA